MTNKRKNKKLLKIWVEDVELYNLMRSLRDGTVPTKLILEIYQRGDII